MLHILHLHREIEKSKSIIISLRINPEVNLYRFSFSQTSFSLTQHLNILFFKLEEVSDVVPFVLCARRTRIKNRFRLFQLAPSHCVFCFYFLFRSTFLWFYTKRIKITSEIKSFLVSSLCLPCFSRLSQHPKFRECVNPILTLRRMRVALDLNFCISFLHMNGFNVAL